LWYALTGIPLFEFLLWRSLLRWAIWARILFGLSRLQLDLVVMHPDRRGGIAFLRLPSIDYCAVFLFAVASVLCAEWGEKVTFEATLASVSPLLLIFAAAATLIAFGPLLAFTPRLLRIRREGLVAYSAVATEHGRRLHERVVRERDQPVDSSDVQASAAIADNYRETADRLRPFLFDERDLLQLLAATLAPVVPMLLAYVPREDLVKLVAVLTGRAH
jgi:hypothetical protein